MAMNATTLKNTLKVTIENQVRSFLNLGVTPYTELTKWSEAMATAIATDVINHIQSNAQTAAQFSGTYPVTGGGGGSITITNQAVNGTVT